MGRWTVSATALTGGPQGSLRPITYAVTETELAKLRDRFAGLSADTPAGYEQIRVALGETRGLRTAVEQRRKDLKAESLDFGRRVDAAAKKLTSLLEEIEAPLQAQKNAVDEAKENAKRAAEKAELLALEAKLKEGREAEEKRLAAEAERQKADRAAFEARQKEADDKRAAEEAQLAADRAKLEADARAVREREEKLAREEAERARAEVDRVATEQAAARAAEETARLEALRPETERVRELAGDIQAFAATLPAMESPQAREAIDWARAKIVYVAEALAKYTPRAG